MPPQSYAITFITSNQYNFTMSTCIVANKTGFFAHVIYSSFNYQQQQSAEWRIKNISKYANFGKTGANIVNFGYV